MAEGGKYDLVVIGAGPGGYTACLRAAELGFRVACVEKEPRVGGVCLNVGCIPSKALLDSSEYFHLAGRRLAEHGVEVRGVDLNLRVMMERKDRIVADLANNVRKLLEAGKVDIVHGVAKVIGPNRVEVIGEEAGAGEKRRVLETGAVLLATGSEAVSLPAFPFDGVRIVSSTEALSFDSPPRHLGVVGGGYIGLELGSVWNRLGSRVTVIEMTRGIAPAVDGQTARALERSLTKQGMAFRLGTKVKSARVTGDEVRLSLESGRGEEELACDRLLVAVGRRPLTRGLGLEELGVETDLRTGHVPVDEQYRSGVPTIYAIGDIIAGPMLAHKAAAEGVAAVDIMAGLPGEVDYDAIPSIVYTSPEAASVGLTEEEAKRRGAPYAVGVHSFAGSGRAKCLGETEGFAKIIVHAKSERILGVHVIGPRASEIIGEAVAAMKYNATIQDVIGMVHGHPTISEALREAAVAARRSG